MFRIPVRLSLVLAVSVGTGCRFEPLSGPDSDFFPDLTIGTSELPSGILRRDYEATLETVGTQGFVTWSIDGGALPDGLTLDPESGVISGVPQEAGDRVFSVRASTGDAAGTATLSITIAGIEPPFGGTIFLDPDIITSDDPTTYEGLVDAGTGERTMFDRREGWITREAYLFNATFTDGLATEVQVNPEFGSVEAARAQAEAYLPELGRLPTALRRDMETVWIHEGVEPFGGGNNNVLIHVGQAADYIADGILEETLVHEAAHTSLDADHAASAGWLEAQALDDTFISTYARDFPDREDIAESFLLWLALRHRPDRISESLKNTILWVMPHRVAYFDSLELDLDPIG